MINTRNKIEIIFACWIIFLFSVITSHGVLTLETDHDEIFIQKQVTLSNNREKVREDNSNFRNMWTKMEEFLNRNINDYGINKEKDKLVTKYDEINQLRSNKIESEINLNDLPKYFSIFTKNNEIFKRPSNSKEKLTNKINRNINEEDSNDLTLSRNIRSINKTDYYAERKAVMDKFHARQREITTKYEKQYLNNTSKIVHKNNQTLNEMTKTFKNRNDTNFDIFKVTSNNSFFGLELNNKINQNEKDIEKKRSRINDNSIRNITNYTSKLNNKINQNEENNENKRSRIGNNSLRDITNYTSELNNGVKQDEENTEKKRSWISYNSLRDITNYTSELNNGFKQDEENTEKKRSWISDNSLRNITNYTLSDNHNCTNLIVHGTYSKQARNQLTISCFDKTNELIVKKPNEPPASRPNRATDGNLIWGTCNGTLVYQHNFSLNVKSPSFLEAIVDIFIDGPLCITCITSLPYNGTKGNVSKESGGQGSRYVKMRFTNTDEQGFSYIIKIWAVVRTDNNCA